MPRRKVRGATLVEVVFGISVSAIVIFGGMIALVSTLGGWSRGQSKIEAELEATQAMRHLRDTLREAMVIQVDIDGKGMTYRLPLRDGDGDYQQPAAWDGITRRFEVRDTGELVAVNDGVERTLVKGVAVLDPRNGNPAPYHPFQPGPGAIVRQVVVQIVTERQIHREGTKAYGRNRETIILRNTPTLIN